MEPGPKETRCSGERWDLLLVVLWNSQKRPMFMATLISISMDTHVIVLNSIKAEGPTP